VLGALGFENAYTLAMRGERAGALGLRTIADLTPLAPRLALGSDLEFLSRPEWAALRNAYGLAFGQEKSRRDLRIFQRRPAGRRRAGDTGRRQARHSLL
jgi:osmoprotectant transport system permease protein